MVYDLKFLCLKISTYLHLTWLNHQIHTASTLSLLFIDVFTQQCQGVEGHARMAPKRRSALKLCVMLEENAMYPSG